MQRLEDIANKEALMDMPKPGSDNAMQN